MDASTTYIVVNVSRDDMAHSWRRLLYTSGNSRDTEKESGPISPIKVYTLQLSLGSPSRRAGDS